MKVNARQTKPRLRVRFPRILAARVPSTLIDRLEVVARRHDQRLSEVVRDFLHEQLVAVERDQARQR